MRYRIASKEWAIEVAIGGECPACQAGNLDCIGKIAGGMSLFYCHTCEWRKWGTPIENDEQPDTGQNSKPNVQSDGSNSTPFQMQNPALPDQQDYQGDPPPPHLSDSPLNPPKNLLGKTERPFLQPPPGMNQPPA